MFLLARVFRIFSDVQVHQALLSCVRVCKQFSPEFQDRHDVLENLFPALQMIFFALVISILINHVLGALI